MSIKRYGLNECGLNACTCNMEERQEGEFVRYEDIAPFIVEQRAQGVEMFAASLNVVGGHEHPYSTLAKKFASQLRKEVTL